MYVFVFCYIYLYILYRLCIFCISYILYTLYIYLFIEYELSFQKYGDIKVPRTPEPPWRSPVLRCAGQFPEKPWEPLGPIHPPHQARRHPGPKAPQAGPPLHTVRTIWRLCSTAQYIIYNVKRAGLQ